MIDVEKFLSRFLLLFGISLSLTLISLAFPSVSYVDAVEFGIPSSGDSDYRKTIVWGYPVPFATDNPYNAGAQKIDADDIFNLGFFLINGTLWFLIIGFIYLIYLAAVVLIAPLIFKR